MFGLTALELARIQFGFTISAHIIFPATSIGLASYLAALEGLWLWKKDTTYRDLYHFWSHIFAVNFAGLTCDAQKLLRVYCRRVSALS
jgi:cytochrome d ubiquinol oxidase subunit I